MTSFAAHCTRLLTSRDIAESPASLLARWSDFVEQCEEGYQWDVSEYENELRTRRILEWLLQELASCGYPDRSVLEGNLTAIDRRFQEVLQQGVEVPGSGAWFERGVLRFAGEPYASYMLQAHGFDVGEPPRHG